MEKFTRECTNLRFCARRQAGYSAAELRSSGFTLQNLKAADFTHQLMTAGFSAAALRVLQNALAASTSSPPSSGSTTRRSSIGDGAIVPASPPRTPSRSKA